MLSASLERMPCKSSGFSSRIFLTSANPEVVPVLPSTRYDAKVNGKPTNPKTVALLPTSSRSLPNTSPTKGQAVVASNSPLPLNLARSASVRIGGIEMAPPSEIWNLCGNQPVSHMDNIASMAGRREI